NKVEFQLEKQRQNKRKGWGLEFKEGRRASHTAPQDGGTQLIVHSLSQFNISEPPQCKTLSCRGGSYSAPLFWSLSPPELIMSCVGARMEVMSRGFSISETLGPSGEAGHSVEAWKIPSPAQVWGGRKGEKEWLAWHIRAPMALSSFGDATTYIWRFPVGFINHCATTGTPTICGLTAPDTQKSVPGIDETQRNWMIYTGSCLFITMEEEGKKGPVASVQTGGGGSLSLTGPADQAAILVGGHTGKAIGVGFRPQVVGEIPRLGQGRKSNSHEIMSLTFCSEQPEAPGGPLPTRTPAVKDLAPQELQHKAKPISQRPQLLWLPGPAV
uniref:Actin related protein 2/3 complex subunit 2 n=1 Tax=Sus scrofa TaxID=9823 RepID=A0A8D1T5A5_PIG